MFQLSCLQPDSLPPAKKWWQNGTGHTISDSGEIRVDDDGRLLIDAVKVEHGGNYTCVAENIAGKTEKSVEIIVTSKPEITSHPSSVTVDENDPSVLTCDYDSDSRPFTVVKWRKDGKTLKHDFDEGSSNRQRIKVFKQNATLYIDSTQTLDRGEYLCEVITAGFEPVLSKPATISVVGKLYPINQFKQTKIFLVFSKINSKLRFFYFYCSKSRLYQNKNIIRYL